MWELRCEECGELFESKRSDTRYCSSSCKQSAYRKREKEPTPIDEISISTEADEVVFEEDQQPTEMARGNQEDKSSSRQLSENDLLLIKVNGYLSHFSIHLRNTYQRKTSVSYLEEILEGLKDLQSQFQQKNMLLYAQYTFADDLEYIVSELSSFIQLTTKSKPVFEIEDSFEELIFALPEEVSEHTQRIREQYY